MPTCIEKSCKQHRRCREISPKYCAEIEPVVEENFGCCGCKTRHKCECTESDPSFELEPDYKCNAKTHAKPLKVRLKLQLVNDGKNKDTGCLCAKYFEMLDACYGGMYPGCTHRDSPGQGLCMDQPYFDETPAPLLSSQQAKSELTAPKYREKDTQTYDHKPTSCLNACEEYIEKLLATKDEPHANGSHNRENDIHDIIASSHLQTLTHIHAALSGITGTLQEMQKAMQRQQINNYSSEPKQQMYKTEKFIEVGAYPGNTSKQDKVLQLQDTAGCLCEPTRKHESRKCHCGVQRESSFNKAVNSQQNEEPSHDEKPQTYQIFNTSLPHKSLPPGFWPILPKRMPPPPPPVPPPFNISPWDDLSWLKTLPESTFNRHKLPNISQPFLKSRTAFNPLLSSPLHFPGFSAPRLVETHLPGTILTSALVERAPPFLSDTTGIKLSSDATQTALAEMIPNPPYTALTPNPSAKLPYEIVSPPTSLDGAVPKPLLIPRVSTSIPFQEVTLPSCTGTASRLEPKSTSSMLGAAIPLNKTCSRSVSFGSKVSDVSPPVTSENVPPNFPIQRSISSTPVHETTSPSVPFGAVKTPLPVFQVATSNGALPSSCRTACPSRATGSKIPLPETIALPPSCKAVEQPSVLAPETIVSKTPFYRPSDKVPSFSCQPYRTSRSPPLAPPPPLPTQPAIENTMPSNKNTSSLPSAITKSNNSPSPMSFLDELKFKTQLRTHLNSSITPKPSQGTSEKDILKTTSGELKTILEKGRLRQGGKVRESRVPVLKKTKHVSSIGCRINDAIKSRIKSIRKDIEPSVSGSEKSGSERDWGH